MDLSHFVFHLLFIFNLKLTSFGVGVFMSHCSDFFLAFITASHRTGDLAGTSIRTCYTITLIIFILNIRPICSRAIKEENNQASQLSRARIYTNKSGQNEILIHQRQRYVCDHRSRCVLYGCCVS